MLMPLMRRGILVFVLLVAAAVAVEPLIHTHPLSQTSNGPCAICVTSVGRLTSLTVTAASPLVAVSTVVAITATCASKPAAGPLSSRAPPAA
jgi:hypothetical protein